MIDVSRRSALLIVHSFGRLQLVLALVFVAASAMPSLYLPPIVLSILTYSLFLQVTIFILSRQFDYFVFPKYSLYALLILVYCIFNAMLTGLGFAELFQYDAIRYDANIFYSFLPFFLFTRTKIREIDVDRWVLVISLLSPIAYITAEILNFPLFESHNAAGGYFMILLAYISARIVLSGFKGWRLSLIVLVLGLIMSDSRGSIAAVIIIFLIHKVFILFPRITKLIFFLGVIGGVGILSYAYSIWQSNGELFLYDYSQFGSSTEGLDFEAFLIGDRPGTVLHRLFYLYPMAIDMFLHSPILGVGFTRFDDFPIQYENVMNIFTMNVTDSVLHTNFHAHNSYLHILSELGILGFVLFVLLIREIFRAFRHDKWAGVPVQFMLGALLIASLTEHRLTTPSQAAPVFVMIGLLWVCSKSRNLT